MTIYSLSVELTEGKKYRLSHLVTQGGTTRVLCAWEADTLDELRAVPQSWGERSASHIWFRGENIPLEESYIPAFPPEPVSDGLIFDIASRWAEPSKYLYKKTDSDVALDATTSAIASLGSSALVLGRYSWNSQMRLLRVVGLMPIFKSNEWLFWLVGAFLLFAFLPLGALFAFSAWSAGQIGLEAENDYIVPIKREDD